MAEIIRCNWRCQTTVLVRTRLIRVAWILSVVVGLTAVCATSAGAKPGSSRAARVLRVDQSDPATSLDPNIQITQDIQRIDAEITEPATKYVLVGTGHSAHYVLKPWLVSAWKQISPRVWRLSVRPNVHFTDGEPLTANAFKATLATVNANPTGYLKSFFSDFQTIKVLNARTFELITSRQDETVPATLTLFYVFAPSAVAKSGETQFGQHPIGTGPYEVASFQPGTQVTLTANPHYWGAKPSITTVDIRFVPAESTRVSDLLSGNADLVEGVDPVSVPQVAHSANDKTLTVVSELNVYLMFSMFQPPFNNVYVRKAVNYAINRLAITNGLFHGYAAGSTQWYIPQLVGYQSGYNPYPYNPTLARQMVQKAGAAAQQTIDFYYPAQQQPLWDEVAQVIQQQLQAVGLKVNLKAGPYPVVSKEFESGSVGGMYLNDYGMLTSEPAILYAYYFTTGSNYGKDELSPEADALVGQIVKQASTPKRVSLYQTLQHDFLANESLIVPLYRPTFIWGASKQLNWQPQASSRYFDFENASWK